MCCRASWPSPMITCPYSSSIMALPSGRALAALCSGKTRTIADYPAECCRSQTLSEGDDVASEREETSRRPRHLSWDPPQQADQRQGSDVQVTVETPHRQGRIGMTQRQRPRVVNRVQEN